jgi:hypothetical protein
MVQLGQHLHAHEGMPMWGRCLLSRPWSHMEAVIAGFTTHRATCPTDTCSAETQTQMASGLARHGTVLSLALTHARLDDLLLAHASAGLHGEWYRMCVHLARLDAMLLVGASLPRSAGPLAGRPCRMRQA